MRKCKVLQLSLQLSFPVVMDICNSLYLYNLSVIGQVAVVAADTLVLYNFVYMVQLIHMQLYATSLQLISTSDSHIHSNMVNEIPTWHFIDLSTMTYVNIFCNLFTTILQLITIWWIFNYFIHPFDEWILLLYFIIYLQLFNNWFNKYIFSLFHSSMGPTTLLGATHSPLDHYFILKIFLESF
jgi:hypothetical protein